MRESALLIVAIAAFIASAFVPGGPGDTATHTATSAPAPVSGTISHPAKSPCRALPTGSFTPKRASTIA